MDNKLATYEVSTIHNRQIKVELFYQETFDGALVDGQAFFLVGSQWISSISFLCFSFETSFFLRYILVLFSLFFFFFKYFSLFSSF